jgi:hypothetical protein
MIGYTYEPDICVAVIHCIETMLFLFVVALENLREDIDDEIIGMRVGPGGELA